MAELVPVSKPELVPTLGSAPSVATSDWRTARALAAVQRQTAVRLASVQGHAYVQSAKCDEVDRLARSAMTGQAMLSQWAGTLAHGDPFAADDLKFFAELAKISKGDIIADTVSDFSREGR